MALVDGKVREDKHKLKQKLLLPILLPSC